MGGSLSRKIPFMPSFHYFPARYIGITYHDYAFNYNKFVEAVVKIYSNFDIDIAGFVAPGCGIPGPITMPIIFVKGFLEMMTVIPAFAGPLHDILGDKYTKWPGRELDVNAPVQIAYVDAPYMSIDEHRELAEDPIRFLSEKIVPRVYRNLEKPGSLKYYATLIRLGIECWREQISTLHVSVKVLDPLDIQVWQPYQLSWSIH